MRELLIGRNAVNYASSKTSTSANTAANPKDLALGAVGIYYLGVNGTNAGKTVLLQSANLANLASTTLGAGVPKSDIRYIFAQGTTDGVIMSKAYAPKDFARIYGKEYVAAQKQVSYVGYNGSTGNLTSGTPTAVDEAVIGFSDVFSAVGPEDELKTISATTAIGDSVYTVAGKLAIAINADAVSPENSGAKFVADVVGDGVLSAIAYVGNVTYTAGDTTITVGTSHNVLANNYLRIVQNAQTGVIDVAAATVANSVVYKVVSVTATTIVLDRAFTGITQTLSAANAITTNTQSTTAPASAGVRLYAYDNVYLQFKLSADEIIAYSTITYSVGINPGSGTANQMARLQKDGQIARGFFGTADGDLYAGGKTPISYINGTVYDLYFFDVDQKVDSIVDSKFAVQSYGMVVAFEDAASIAGQNQFEFDAIVMGATGIFGTPAAPISETSEVVAGDATPAS